LLQALEIRSPAYWYLYDKNLLDTVSQILIERSNKHFVNLVFNKDKNYFRHRYSDNLKICKQCLYENKHHQYSWEELTNTHCAYHNVLLINSCVHIYANKTWDNELLCKKCVIHTPASARPTYLIYRDSLTTEDRKQEFDNFLMGVATHLFRPFDFLLPTLRWSTLPVELVLDLLKDAFKIACISDIHELWGKATKQHRDVIKDLGDTAIEHGIAELVNVLHNDFDLIPLPATNFPKILNKWHAHFPHNCITAMKRLTLTKNIDDLSFQVNGLILARILGVNNRAITVLSETGVFPIIHKVPQVNNQVFDIRVIKETLFNQFNQIPLDRQRFVAFPEINEPFLEMHNLKKEDIVLAAMTGNLPAYFSVNGSGDYANNLKIREDALIQFAQSHVMSTDHLTIEQVALILYVNPTAVKELILKGYMSFAKYQKVGEPLIDSHSFCYFLSHYICINRETELRGVNLSEMILSLKTCCAVEADFTYDMTFYGPKVKNYGPQMIIYNKDVLSQCCLHNIYTPISFNSPQIDLSTEYVSYRNYVA
jgi:hypothetical protein